MAQGKYPLNFGPGTVMYQLEKRGLKFGVVSEFKDYGAYLSPGFGTAMFINRAPPSQRRKGFLNWLLTKDGQNGLQQRNGLREPQSGCAHGSRTVLLGTQSRRQVLAGLLRGRCNDVS